MARRRIKTACSSSGAGRVDLGEEGGVDDFHACSVERGWWEMGGHGVVW